MPFLANIKHTFYRAFETCTNKMCLDVWKNPCEMWVRHYDVSFECPSVKREKLTLTLFQVVETKFIPNIDVIKGQKQMLLKVVKTMCVKYSGKIMHR